MAVDKYRHASSLRRTENSRVGRAAIDIGVVWIDESPLGRGSKRFVYIDSSVFTAGALGQATVQLDQALNVPAHGGEGDTFFVVALHCPLEVAGGFFQTALAFGDPRRNLRPTRARVCVCRSFLPTVPTRPWPDVAALGGVTWRR